MREASAPYFDVAIIGGGPAGVSAALTARPIGASVIVIDVPQRERPPEIVPAITMSILRTLHLDPDTLLSDCPRVTSYVSMWNDGVARRRSKIASAFGQDFLVNRSTWADHLRRAAQDAGVQWHQGRATHITRMPNRDLQVIAADGTRVSCHRLIIATGRAPLAALQGNAILTVDRRVAIYPRQATTGSQPPRSAELILESGAGRWWYGICVDHQPMIPVMVIDADQLPRREDWRAWFDTQLRATSLLSERSDAERHDQNDLQVCSARVFARRTAAGDGWLLAGDARLAIDPLSGNGILRALQDGSRAARFALSDHRHCRVHQYSLIHAKDFAMTREQRVAALSTT